MQRRRQKRVGKRWNEFWSDDDSGNTFREAPNPPAKELLNEGSSTDIWKRQILMVVGRGEDAYTHKRHRMEDLQAPRIEEVNAKRTQDNVGRSGQTIRTTMQESMQEEQGGGTEQAWKDVQKDQTTQAGEDDQPREINRQNQQSGHSGESRQQQNTQEGGAGHPPSICSAQSHISRNKRQNTPWQQPPRDG